MFLTYLPRLMSKRETKLIPSKAPRHKPRRVTNSTVSPTRARTQLDGAERTDYVYGRSSVSHQKLFSPREAAQVLGISYPTLKQWIYKKKIRTLKTAGGHHRIPEAEIDRFLYRASQGGEVTERRSSFRRLSGRNQLVGRVTDVKISGLMAQVTLSIGGQHITSIITADAVREMRLQKGQTAAALIKSTEVMILRA
jgi:molybdopterin-binding protein